ncbi:MAG: hypothetical protein ACLSWS_03445 [Faecalispora jeddahensis]
MAEKFFPFNSVSGDREYDAEDFAAYFADMISSGVSANGDNLGVTPAGGLNLSVGPGKAMIQGHQYRNTATLQFTVPAGNSNPRIDRVVARLDVAARRPLLAVVSGTPSSTPTPPALTRNNDYYEIGLAEIYVAASAIEISAANITDTRTDNDVCGVVRCLVEKLDIEAFMKNNWATFNSFMQKSKSVFMEWFAQVREVLDEDTAGYLFNLINAHTSDTAAHITTYIHTKSGNIHNFSGTGSNGKARITADFVEGDTFTVNGQSVTAKLQNGEQPTGEFFAEGCWVQFIYDADANQLNFSAGGIKQIPTTYAGKLTVSVAAYDGGGIANTKVRIQNSSLGMDLAYTPDALGKVTVELTGNKTYSITLIDVPEPYYGEAATQYIGFDSETVLSLQLKDQPDIIGFKMNLTTGEITYTDGAVGWSPMVMDWDTDTLDPGYFINSWLVKDIRPCLLKNGVVQYYLKRTGFLMYDYSLQENGQPSNLTGVDGDVMIEHPRLWFHTFMQTESGVNFVYIQISKQKINSTWTDGPFMGRETFYYPAYLPGMVGDKMVSVSGLSIFNQTFFTENSTYNETTTTFSLPKIQSRLGTGWTLRNGTFPYFLTMFNILFKTTDLSVLGTIPDNDSARLTGRNNTRPLIYGYNLGSGHFKFLGTEDLFYRNLVHYNMTDGYPYLYTVSGTFPNSDNINKVELRVPNNSGVLGFTRGTNIPDGYYLFFDTLTPGPIHISTQSFVIGQSSNAYVFKKAFPFIIQVSEGTSQSGLRLGYAIIKNVLNNSTQFKTEYNILLGSQMVYDTYSSTHNYQSTTYSNSKNFIPRFSFHPPLEP